MLNRWQAFSDDEIRQLFLLTRIAPAVTELKDGTPFLEEIKEEQANRDEMQVYFRVKKRLEAQAAKA